MTMSKSYQAWIVKHCQGDMAGRCAEMTLMMQDAFPELQRVRGHYDEPFVGPRPHWWLVAPDGTVVDPTASQFFPCGEYFPRDESLPEPTGKCLGCGVLVYDHVQFCSRECAQSTVDAIMGGRRPRIGASNG